MRISKEDLMFIWGMLLSFVVILAVKAFNT